MLKAVLFAAAIALAAQDKPQPKRSALTENEALKLENLQLRYDTLVREICTRAEITPASCIVDPRTGFVYERPAPPTPTKKEEPKK